MGEQPVRSSSTADGLFEIGTADVAQMHLSVNNVQLCASGFHAWVPWLTLPNGSYVTWCVRPGCDEHQQYDLTGSSPVPEEDTDDVPR